MCFLKNISRIGRIYYLNDLPKRKPNRLNSYDYSQSGLYFITICVKDKRHLLGKIDQPNNAVILSRYGKIVKNKIMITESYFSCASFVQFVIMPNHIHFIINLKNEEYQDNTSQERFNMKIPLIVSMLKRLINKEVGFNIWQRSYHDHIIRNEREYKLISDYIQNNPANWNKDCFYN